MVCTPEDRTTESNANQRRMANMRRGRKWQTVAVVGLALASAWAGQARADFAIRHAQEPGPAGQQFRLRVRSGHLGRRPGVVFPVLPIRRIWRMPTSTSPSGRRSRTRGRPHRTSGPPVNTAAAESGPSLSVRRPDPVLQLQSRRRLGRTGPVHDHACEPVRPVGQAREPRARSSTAHSARSTRTSRSDGLSLYFADVEGDSSVAAAAPGGQGKHRMSG